MSIIASLMRSAAEPFVLTVDEVRKEGFQMLDVEGVLDRETCRFKFSLFQKSTNIWNPLSPHSMHPFPIHVHWPKAQCSRIRSRFSNPRLGEAAVQQFKSKYRKLFHVNVNEERKASIAHKTTSWMILPFHRCLVRGKFAKICSSLFLPSSLGTGIDEKVRISWRLNSQHLVHRVRRIFVSDE